MIMVSLILIYVLFFVGESSDAHCYQVTIQLTLITIMIHFLNTGGSCLMRISLLRISLLWFFKTITKIWLMRFYGQFILLVRT